MNKSEIYTYWKKPWHKWLVLGGAVLQIIAMRLRIADFLVAYQQKANLFSVSEWEIYARSQLSQFALSGFLIAILMVIFIIGVFARSSKAVDISTGILFLCISLLCAVVGFLLNVMNILWFAFSIVSLIAGIHSIWKSRRV